MSAPLVSIVIPTHNAGESLQRCLGPLSREPRVECIVVDNASTDASVDLAAERFTDLVIVRCAENLGFAAACNRGAATATAPYVLFLNDDALVEGDSLAGLVAVAETQPKAWAWQPCVVDLAGAPESAGALATRSGFFRYLRSPTAPNPYYVFAIECACLLVRREVFTTLGGFHESYFAYFEMTDLCWRARLSGWVSVVVPDVECYHVGGQTTRRIMEAADVHFLAYRNRLTSLLANRSMPGLVTSLAFHLLGCLALAIGFGLTGRWRSAIGVLRALAWPLTNGRAIGSQRRAVQQGRRYSDREVFSSSVTVRLASWAIGQFRSNVRNW